MGNPKSPGNVSISCKKGKELVAKIDIWSYTIPASFPRSNVLR
jgi:hypothetical protein